MPRPRSAKVADVKQKLIARIRDGFHGPGQRFFSNRALSKTFGLSYQTAHRLMEELHAEGWLARKAGSGTYVADPAHQLRGAVLVFNPRAERPDSFGARLLALVSSALALAKIDCTVVFAETVGKLPGHRLPIFWECRGVAESVAGDRRFAVLLNDRPPAGLQGLLVDSFSGDDYSGGAAAAQILTGTGTRRRRFGVLAGPQGDWRSVQRTQGFRDHAPKCQVLYAGTWFAEEAAQVARRAALRDFDAVFCCNDRLGEALIAACQETRRPRPAIVGFDDAPVSESLDLTTLTVPWERLTADLVALVERRLAGDATGASGRIYAPHPVMRLSHRVE